MRSSTPARRATASPRRWRSSTSRPTTCASSPSASRADRAAAAEGLRRAHEAIEATRIARLARESELASARIEHEWRARSVRAQEQALAGLEARLKSLAELEAARAAYGDAPRAVLAQANGKVNQQGAIADYLEVEAGYERAVEAYLGDLLQHVVVERPEHAAAGFEVVREAGAGRCGFLITSRATTAAAAPPKPREPRRPLPDGLIALSSIVRVNGPFADADSRARSARRGLPIRTSARRRRAA